MIKIDYLHQTNPARERPPSLPQIYHIALNLSQTLTLPNRSFFCIDDPPEYFDYSRAHRLVMERVHIDEMDPDISQYLANEAWKSRLSDYKQQYYATVKNHDISYQHSGQRVDLNAIQQNPNVVMLRPYDRQ